MGDQSGRQQLSDALADLLARSQKTKAQVASEGSLSRTTVSAAFSPDGPPPSDRTIEVLAGTLNADPVPLRNLLAIARNEEAARPRSVVAETRRSRDQEYRIRELPDPRLREYSFDPLRPESLVHSVVERFRSVEAASLVKAASWARNSGIYAIYYIGANELYAPVSGTSIPLYVGGVQKGPGSVPMDAYLKPPAVSVRLEEHCRTLDQSRNLDPMDFCVRVLFIDDLFIAPAVAELNSEFKPLWNTTLEGFSIRHPGRTRIQHAPRPKWHELHAGPDSWAAEMRSKRTPDELENEVRQHFTAWLR
ncbi:Eco29kI family restriction endonuclease [Kitasatospora sp. NPDC088779]|uniref:Eco29kI family restriction endonuclease n=1 Tax=unclassified Kitasatospora TaxID=2633591 RepID=UPI0034464D32